MTNMKKKSVFFILLILVAVIFGQIIEYPIQNNSVYSAEEQQKEIFEHITKYRVPDFMFGEAFALYDVRKDVILAGNKIEARKPIASITKIMTAYTALEYLPLNYEITISTAAAETEDGLGALRALEKFKVRDLITLLMTASSNDSATALAEKVGEIFGGKDFESKINLFVEEMNKNALILGMTNTTFINPTGLDLDESTPSNYSSVRDLIVLISKSYKHKIIWELSRDKFRSVISKSNLKHDITNTNAIASLIPNFTGSKTGTTDAAGESLIFTFEQPYGEPLIYILLNAKEGTRYIKTVRFLQTNNIL